MQNVGCSFTGQFFAGHAELAWRRMFLPHAAQIDLGVCNGVPLSFIGKHALATRACATERKGVVRS